MAHPDYTILGTAPDNPKSLCRLRLCVFAIILRTALEIEQKEGGEGLYPPGVEIEENGGRGAVFLLFVKIEGNSGRGGVIPPPCIEIQVIGGVFPSPCIEIEGNRGGGSHVLFLSNSKATKVEKARPSSLGQFRWKPVEDG